MKIAFYGSSLLSSWWNGAATYYRGLLREHEELVHVTIETQHCREDHESFATS